MAGSTARALERIRYWQGQLLASDDLRTQIEVDQALRRLHDRAVHRAFGIAIGLAATLKNGSVHVDCGMAFDCGGNALIVQRDRTLPMPDVSAPLTLVLTGDAGSADGVALRWKPAQKVRPATENRHHSAPAGGRARRPRHRRSVPPSVRASPRAPAPGYRHDDPWEHPLEALAPRRRRSRRPGRSSTPLAPGSPRRHTTSPRRSPPRQPRIAPSTGCPASRTHPPRASRSGCCCARSPGSRSTSPIRRRGWRTCRS